MYLKNLFYFFLALLFLGACHAPKVEENMGTQRIVVVETILNSPVSRSLRGISVVDENIAWLSGAGGSILKTVDGGNEWKLLNQPDTDSLDFRSVHAFDDQIALIASAGYPSRIYKTINGGENWTLVHENTDSSSFMNSIAFSDSQNGVILGDQLNGWHMILVTEDQGEHWTQLDSNSLPKPLAIENGFAASGSCIAIDQNQNYYIGLGGEQSRVFHSTNGNQWTATTTPMLSGSPSTGIYSLAAGKDGLMAVGGDYTQVDSMYQPAYYSYVKKKWEGAGGKVNGYRSIVDYCEHLNAWLAGGTNGIDLSLDEGKSWHKISTTDINTLQFIPNTAQAFMADKKGNVYHFDLQATEAYETP